MGTWPDAVALLVGDVFACSGTLVAPDLVLSADHCDVTINGAVLSAIDWTLGDRLAVTERIPHPNADRGYDVALFRLASVAPVPPRPLVSGCARSALVEGASVTIAGWGAVDTAGSEVTTELHEVRSTIRSLTCDETAVGCRGTLDVDVELIAGGGGSDSCIGDSGGPLYLMHPDGPVLVGTTSRGVLGTSRSCGDGGIYVRSDAVDEWVRQVAGSPLPLPACAAIRHPPDPVDVAFGVPSGGSGWWMLYPFDPDEGDRAAWSIVQGPVFGAVELSNHGLLRYVARGAPGSVDQIVVRATDATGLEGEAVVEVDILPAHERGHGCGHGPAASLLLLLPLRRRPRR